MSEEKYIYRDTRSASKKDNWKTARFICCLFLSLLMMAGAVFPVRAGAVILVKAAVVDALYLEDYMHTMEIGESYVLAYSCNLPGSISFVSSDKSVASVTKTGIIRAKKAGTCQITATFTEKEGSKATGRTFTEICTVTVKDPTVNVSEPSITLGVGEYLRIYARASNASVVKWKSSDKGVCSIDSTGLIRAKKPGTATVTAFSAGGSDQATVTVTAPDLTLSESSASLYRGQTLQLRAKTDAAGTVKWKTNKKSVATVSEEGLVTAVKHGQAVITCSLNGVSRTCTVTVNQPTITLSQTEVTAQKGDVIALTAKVSSGNTPVWSSGSPDKASVDDKGTVTVLDYGTVTISCKEDGVTAKCKIICKKPAASE